MSNEEEGINFTAQNMVVIAAIIISAHPLVYSAYSNTNDTKEEGDSTGNVSNDEKHFYEELDEITKKLDHWISEAGNGFSGVARAIKVLGIEITGDDLKKVLQKINMLGNKPAEVEGRKLDFLLPSANTTIN